MRRILLSLVAILLAIGPGPGSAASFEPKTFDELANEAEQIFVATVSAATSRRLPSGGIVTDLSFANSQVLKPGIAGGDITLLVFGGTVGGETIALRGVPKFQLGATYLVFARGNGSTVFPVVGGDQGMFQVKEIAATGERLVFNARGMPITSPSVLQAVSALAPEIRDSASIPLDVLLQAVGNRLGR